MSVLGANTHQPVAAAEDQLQTVLGLPCTFTHERHVHVAIAAMSPSDVYSGRLHVPPHLRRSGYVERLEVGSIKERAIVSNTGADMASRSASPSDSTRSTA